MKFKAKKTPFAYWVFLRNLQNKKERKMALPEVHQPIRSISLPSRIHPPSVKLEAALNQLKPWQTSSSTNSVPFGAETLQIGLINLAEVYNCFHELIQSPLTSHSLLHHQNGKVVEDALDGSVTLLDTCDTATNVLLTLREHFQNLQSALRRRGRSSDSCIESQINEYFAFRKKAKKEMNKHIGGLKKLESKACYSVLLVDADHHLEMAVKVLREATRIAISIFRSLLLFLSTTPATKTNARGFSFFSKLIHLRSSSLSEKGQKLINEVQSIDLVLNSIPQKWGIEVQTVKKMLESLDDSIQGLEAGLKSVFRCLVQSRVSFLNILTSHC